MLDMHSGEQKTETDEKSPKPNCPLEKSRKGGVCNHEKPETKKEKIQKQTQANLSGSGSLLKNGGPERKTREKSSR